MQRHIQPPSTQCNKDRPVYLTKLWRQRLTLLWSIVKIHTHLIVTNTEPISDSVDSCMVNVTLL